MGRFSSIGAQKTISPLVIETNMTDIIITDLTRFGNREFLCVAGLTMDGQHCIRPLKDFDGRNPAYLSYAGCKEHNVLPGTILSANYTRPQQIDPPHVEDSIIAGKIRVAGVATSAQFEGVLEASAFDSIDAGFGVAMNEVKKYSIQLQKPARSIITLRVDPKNFEVFEDKYGKLRAHVTDSTGAAYRYLSVTDLGFFDNVGAPANRRMSASDALSVIHRQKSLYLRVGLSRAYEGSYWLQINGIYTFPDYSLVVRQY
jgi:hypothetical protein